MDRSPRRDIVVIGASAGGVEALSRLVSMLPEGLPAALFVVLHVSPGIRSRLPEILERRGRLPVSHARDGDAIEPGRIVVAPPEYHMELASASIRLVHGPRQNSSRPSVDALFQSAAANHRSRVVGVVLSGYLDDGAEGMRDIVRSGGLGIAQDPAEAPNPEMPENAIARAELDLVLPLAGIAKKIEELAAASAGAVMGRTDMPHANQLRPRRPGAQIGAEDIPGVPTGLTCPECHGAPWAGADAVAQVFQCRVGHVYSIDTLQEEQRIAVERALWAAVRSLSEQATIADHIASRSERRGTEATSRRYRNRERVARENADILEKILMRDMPDPEVDEPVGGLP